MSSNVLLIDHPISKQANDFRLMRLCQWAGFSLGDFARYTIGDGQGPPWTNSDHPSRVLVPMGPWATDSLGIPGQLLHTRGYVWSGPAGTYVVPTVGPGFIQKGNSRWSAPFIADLQKAVTLGRDGLPSQFTDYLLDPVPGEAYAWAHDYLRLLGEGRCQYLAFDIETPGKGDEEEDLDLESDAPDRTWRIERIGFAYRGLSGISFPWSPEYIPTVRLLLGSGGPKVVWNAGFDVPRLRRVGIDIRGTIHDGMVAWHILHSDLPKSLRFVATFTCPWQPAWKHLSGAKPAFYNCTDADVEVRSMEVIEAQLRKASLWSVYERDVVALEPILVHMHRKGMPVDPGVRLDRATKLAERTVSIRRQMEAAVPLEARRIAIVYTNTPKDTTGLLSRSGRRLASVCSVCGALKPRKDHFKRYVKKQNPCADGGPRQCEIDVVEYFRLADFTPSRDQLIRYHHFLGRPLPMVFDKKERKKKVSFAERQLKELAGKYPDDVLYSLILDYRQLDKIAGTYIGRPDGSSSV
jgi:hypothetical protein